jgi:hypothetical protein
MCKAPTTIRGWKYIEVGKECISNREKYRSNHFYQRQNSPRITAGGRTRE